MQNRAVETVNFQKLPPCAKSIVVIYYFIAAIDAISGFLGIFTSIPGYPQNAAKVSSAFTGLLGCAIFYVMQEFLHGKNWARWIVIVASVVSAISFLTIVAAKFENFSAPNAIFIFLLSLIPLAWFAWVCGYLFFSKKIKMIYEKTKK